MKAYYGDFHKHMMMTDRVDSIIEDARHTLDFYAVLCYPFRYESHKGLLIESLRQRPEFLATWERLQRAARDHHRPGEFVTFLGYEWHGNRTRWGDHNVIYFDEDNPLDDAWELSQLYANLRQRKAVAIPHHTAYAREHRGKDWSVFDSALSPVMEIFSAHGCSEAVDSPLPMDQNQSMGPRVSDGTLVAALGRGLRVGVIASNDGSGLPGSWGRGIAGLWAEELTRDALWDALLRRRTFGTTGERMDLLLVVNGEPMGGEIAAADKIDAEVRIVCRQPLDRIELIHNGIVAQTHCHRGAWERKPRSRGRYRVLMECGWGPHKRYGFQDVALHWKGTADVRGGRLLSASPRFTTLGQSYALEDDSRCRFVLNSSRNAEWSAIQGLVLEIEGDADTEIAVHVDGREFRKSLRDLFDANALFAFCEESVERIERVFGVRPGEFENPDVFQHNARKIRLGPAWPEASYDVSVRFSDLPSAKGDNYYYVRASQIDGQTAWSSPVWMVR